MKAEGLVRILPPKPQPVRLCLTLISFIAIIAAFPAAGATYLTGGLCHELYTNIPGVLIADLTNSAKFPGAPDVVDVVTGFETPSLSGDCYGERVSGYLLPPTTGDYVFYLASDDQGLLYLSPDANPTNKAPIATETYWAFPRMWTGLSGGRVTSENVSAPIHLEAGRAYYIEGLHKEFGGGDNFGVAWQLPGGAVPTDGDPPIPGQYLARLGSTQDVAFDVAFFTSSSATTEGQVFWRHYTLAGPQQGQTLLPGRPIVPDAGGRYFYEAHPHVVIKIDSQTGTSTEMRLGPSVPELSWPTSVAFDSTRNRELLTSFGGEGYLYSYAPERDAWSLVSSMKDLDVFSLVHHAPQDALYGLGVFSPYFYRFNAQGTYQEQWYLSQLPHYGITDYQCALISVGDYIVMLIGPDPTFPGNNPVQEAWIYTFDTRTAELRQTWHQRHIPPNASPSVALTSATEGAVFQVGVPAQLVADARDGDGTVASVEFYLNNQRLGLGTRIPDTASFALNWTPPATGDYKLQVLATDDDGMVTLSSPVHVTASMSLPVPKITWGAPPAILYGTALSSLQLNATANVPGSFTYTPPAGTYLHAGTSQTLTAVFTPNDSQHYSTATNHVTITVLPAALTIRADDKSRSHGAPNPPLTATYIGLVAGDSPVDLDTPVTLTTTAIANSPPGTYSIVASGASDADYIITHLNGTLTVLAHGGGSGSVDLTFDPTARGRRTGLEGDFGYVYALALQADGKVIVSGDFIGANGIPHRDLVRLLPDGSVDPSFRVITTTHSIVEAMDIQANGQILIAGNFGEINGVVRPWLARLNRDGTLDPTFAPVFGGVTHEVVRGVCVQPDQKILVGGNFTTVNGQARYHVARLNPNGTPDETFQPLAPVPANSMSFNCIALQPDGKVLLGHATCDTNWALCRLESNGARDSSFMLGVTQSPWCSGVRQVVLQPGGKIIALGQFGPWRYLVRLNSDGSADNTFASTPIHWQIYKILAQPDGKILVGGEHRNETWPEPPALLRLSVDGMLDTGFQVPEGVVDYPNDVYALALRPDGRVLMGKRYEPYNGNRAAAVVQLQPGGLVDRTFSYRLNAPRAVVSAIAPLPDGRALIGGQFTRLNDVRRVGLARVQADGTIDETFVPPAALQLVETVVLQPDGRALVAGNFYNTNAPFNHNLIRVNPNGSLDRRFRLPPAFRGLVHALALQGDGKILVGGEVWVGEALPRYFLRLNPDGSIDTSFDLGTGFRGRDSSINAIVVQPDNKILVAPEDMGTYNDVRIGPLVRLNPNGHLDEGFAPDPRIGFAWRVALQPGGGILVLADKLTRLRSDGSLDPIWRPAEYYWGSAVAVQPDGKPIISVQMSQDSQVHDIIRLNWDGSLDPTFACSLGNSGWADTIALEKDGGILIGGQFEEVNGELRDSLARLNNILTPPQHPADSTPADWTLSRQEVFAYGAAWRTGGVWALPPNPIPIDYATRASALWQGSQRYFWDSSISEPPVWWVDSLPPRHKQPDKDGWTWSRRSAPRHYTAGEPFEVTVKLSHFPGTLAEAVQEEIPPGCSVHQISDNGQVDRVNRQIKWGPFTEPGHLNLRYCLIPAFTNTAPIHLAGLVSIDGASQAVEGADQVKPSGRLLLTHHSGHDRFGLRLEGDPGTALFIETSTNLVDWTVLSTVTNTQGTAEIEVPVQPNSAQRYYRARVVDGL